MSLGRPVIYSTEEERAEGRRKAAIKAYLKKNNISDVEYMIKKRVVIEKKNRKMLKKWIKQRLKTDEGTDELILIFLKAKAPTATPSQASQASATTSQASQASQA